MIVRTMLNALLVLQLGLVLLLAAAPPEDLGGTDIAELGERIMTLLELCQKKIAHSGDSISSPAPDPPDKAYSISTCRGPSQDQRRFRKSGKKSVTVTEVEKTEEPEKKTMQPRKLPARREGERQLLLWPTKRRRRKILRRNQMPREEGEQSRGGPRSGSAGSRGFFFNNEVSS
jgi:hypothetical protein